MVMRAESSAELANRKGSKFFSQCGTLRYGAQYREKYRESIGSKIRHKGTCAKGLEETFIVNKVYSKSQEES